MAPQPQQQQRALLARGALSILAVDCVALYLLPPMRDWDWGGRVGSDEVSACVLLVTVVLYACVAAASPQLSALYYDSGVGLLMVAIIFLVIKYAIVQVQEGFDPLNAWLGPLTRAPLGAMVLVAVGNAFLASAMAGWWVRQLSPRNAGRAARFAKAAQPTLAALHITVLLATLAGLLVTAACSSRR